MPQVEDRAHAGVRLEGVLGRRVVDEPGNHQAVGLCTERGGDATERLALRSRRPIAAGQRHDGGADRGCGIVQRVGDGTHGGAVPDPDDGPVTDLGAQDLGAQAPDHAAGQVLGPGDGRGEVDGIELEIVAKHVRGR